MDDMDPELLAMAKASQAIGGLEDDAAKQRVIDWLTQKFGLTSTPTKTTNDEQQVEQGVGTSGAKQYGEFAELFNAFSPESDTERLLVGAYWFQVIEGNDSWYSVSINKLLKPTGYGIGKIARVLSGALKQKPAKVIQLKRNGSNQQAKKACKLTTEGIAFVENRLKG